MFLCNTGIHWPDCCYYLVPVTAFETSCRGTTAIVMSPQQPEYLILL
jgi:hypothetical protein